MPKDPDANPEAVRKMEAVRQFGLLATQTSLIRRGYVRRALINAWDKGKPFTGIRDLKEHLRDTYGIDVHFNTINTDLKAIGAVKASPEGARKVYWIVPAKDPESEPVRASVDQRTIENELSHRLFSYALDAFVHDKTVIINTAMFCGKMVGHWVSMLKWQEIIHVASFDHSVMILCLTEEFAEGVRTRLLGEIAGAPIGKGKGGFQ